jgi:hypothetical protein
MFFQRYEPKAGIGTLTATMLPWPGNRTDDPGVRVSVRHAATTSLDRANA